MTDFIHKNKQLNKRFKNDKNSNSAYKVTIIYLIIA